MTYRKMHPQFKQTFNNYEFPEEMQEAFWNYLAYGWDPGSFGTAILRNNFMDAVARAHRHLTAECFRQMAVWFANVPPPMSFGTDAKIEAWKALTDDERRDIMIEYGLRPSVIDVLMGTPA